MLLTEMILEDVGTYGGPNIFDLTAKPGRPVVLYGGSNGSGKTTLFESIPLCLYGQGFERKTTRQYHEKISRLFHRRTQRHAAAKEASVMLGFQFAQSGKIIHHRVKRTWYNINGKITESLAVSRSPNGRKYSPINMDMPNLQILINQMIPRNVAGMFFFDGEKIQDIAESGGEDAHIRASFDSLLGLNLAGHLYDSIDLYITRNTDGASKAILKELEQGRLEKHHLEEKIGKMQEREVFFRAEIERRRRDLEMMEEEFFKAGGNFAQQRQKLINEKTDVERNVAMNDGILRGAVEGILPLAIVPDRLREVKADLESDMAKTKTRFEKETISEAFGALSKKYKQALDSYPEKTKNYMVEKLDGVMDSHMRSLSGVQKTKFGFSIPETESMISKIDLILNESFVRLKANRDAHEHYLKELRNISAKLSIAPQQDEIGPMYSKIKDVTIEISEMDQELQTLSKVKSQEKSLMVILNAKIRKLLDSKKKQARNLRGLEMAPRVQDVLDDYSRRLRARKIKLLESNILEGIKRCFHKNGLIERIHIDPETYSIALYNNSDDLVTREQLSQGELQMYATAIVWGLAKTSGKPLPFVIDTPLARLDDQHRENMITNFYPNASHQIVIFSTNTEIAGPYFDLIKPHVSQARMIRYDADSDQSMAGDGYFDDMGGRRIAS